MKILAILDVSPGAPLEIIRATLANELKGSWALFALGVLREAYATATLTRVVFVLERRILHRRRSTFASFRSSLRGTLASNL